ARRRAARRDRQRRHPRGDRLRGRLGDRLPRRLVRALAQHHHAVREGHGPDRRQAARHRRARQPRLAEPARRVGRDGDHRPRARGHGRPRAGVRRDPRRPARQAQDRHPGGRDLLRDPVRPDPGVGRRPRLRRRRGDRRQRRDVLPGPRSAPARFRRV
ncbi:MAG: CDP-diacylglycerol--glycerol-3-phosphate 3-phosphatidyltransferase, partial [uncultured Solirubrobacteraceae bacterium]